MPNFEKPAECMCSKCPLQTQPACGDEIPIEPKYVLLGESPGGREILDGRPFVGKSGTRLNRDLRYVGLARGDAVLTNTVMCRPFKVMTKGQWKRAIMCCAPHLNRILAQTPGLPVFAMGGPALIATALKDSISKWYGYPLEMPGYPGRLVFPSIHPALALRRPWWEPTFLECLKRFALILNGKWKPWVNPPMYWKGSDSELAARLAALDRALICVVSETACSPPI